MSGAGLKSPAPYRSARGAAKIGCRFAKYLDVADFARFRDCHLDVDRGNRTFGRRTGVLGRRSPNRCELRHRKQAGKHTVSGIEQVLPRLCLCAQCLNGRRVRPADLGILQRAEGCGHVVTGYQAASVRQ